MAVVLTPNGTLFGVISIAAGVPLVKKVWEPAKAPKAIGPGELDAVTTSTNLLYWQWKQSPSWVALAQIIGTAAQSVVGEQFEIAEYRYLSTGFGEILDEIGAVVDLQRNSLEEELYRRAIRARGASTIGDAGIDAVMRPAKAILGAANVSYLPQYPASFCYVVSLSLSQAIIDLLIELLSPPNVAPSGVGSKILIATPVTPGWSSSAGPSSWNSSWSSTAGATSLYAVSGWTHAITLS